MNVGYVVLLVVVEQFLERRDVLFADVLRRAADKEQELAAVLHLGDRMPALGLFFGGNEKHGHPSVGLRMESAVMAPAALRWDG